MNILVCPNLDKQNGLECTRQTVKTLGLLGAETAMDEGFRPAVGDVGCRYGKFSSLLTACDVLMPVGGDGTVMRMARHAVAADKPVLAVNAGRVGFLTQVELHELENLRLLTEGRYTESRRMLLEAALVQGGRPRRFLALNDVVVSRSDADNVVDIEVLEQEMLIARQRADGLIFSTPTGSTAYSLSAGGPIVDPRMELLVLSPVCAHSTFSRSVILPAESVYTVADRTAHNPKGLAVSVDGRRVGKIHGDEAVTVRRAPANVRFIELGLRSFYESVNEKLSWGR